MNQRKIATDLQIADRLQEQRKLIDNQEIRINNVNDRLSSVEQHIDFFVKAAQTTVYHFGASFLKYEDREQRQCLH